MAVRAHGQRHAPFIECFRNLLCRSSLGASIENARYKMAHAEKRVRIVNASGFHSNLDRHGRNGVRVLRNNDGTVIEDVARCREPLLHYERHCCAPSVGLNQPTVRRSRRRYFFATRSTSSCVTAAILFGASSYTSRLATV